jgi:hypothetical protein
MFYERGHYVGEFTSQNRDIDRSTFHYIPGHPHGEKAYLCNGEIGRKNKFAILVTNLDKLVDNFMTNNHIRYSEKDKEDFKSQLIQFIEDPYAEEAERRYFEQECLRIDLGIGEEEEEEQWEYEKEEEIPEEEEMKEDLA